MVLVGLALLLTGSAGAQQPADRAPGFAVHLFPPELIMQYQRRIELTGEQRSAITAAVQDLQARVVELQWQMQDETQGLADVLSQALVDSSAALAQIDRVLDVERRVKRAHLGMLVVVKNTLTARQQELLQGLRPRDEPKGGSGREER
jgi:Spy/CpxP family protein refolding chaperone